MLRTARILFGSDGGPPIAGTPSDRSAALAVVRLSVQTSVDGSTHTLCATLRTLNTVGADGLFEGVSQPACRVRSIELGIGKQALDGGGTAASPLDVQLRGWIRRCPNRRTSYRRDAAQYCGPFRRERGFSPPQRSNIWATCRFRPVQQKRRVAPTGCGACSLGQLPARLPIIMAALRACAAAGL